MKEIKAFVDTLIPAKLPKERKAELAAELESHLYEKVDFYMEIGYSQDESTKKAIDDFAEDESVRNGIFNEFERLYRERTWWAFAAAGVVFAMNIIAFFFRSWLTPPDNNVLLSFAGAFIGFVVVFVLIFGIMSARIGNLQGCIAVHICLHRSVVGRIHRLYEADCNRRVHGNNHILLT